MRYLTLISGVLLVVGGLNWGLVGLFEYDLVAEICGETFGSTNAVSRIIYVLVGVAAIVHLPALLAMLRGDGRQAEHGRRDTVLNA
jgi:uncharacterized membrane protein YuzA (DUF378 family)